MILGDSARWAYRVTLDGAVEDTTRACVDLHALAEALPHGCGLDGDWCVTVARSGNVTARNAHHVMSEHGYYMFWTPVIVHVKLAPPGGGHRLDVTVRCANAGRHTFGLRDMYEDEMHHALADLPGPSEETLAFARDHALIEKAARP